MRKRPLGKTGLFVSEMGLGTWGLSGDPYGPVTAATAERVIARAIDVGITLIDTADAYGAGKMEHLLQEALRPHRNKNIVVVTKGGVDRSTEPPRKRFDRDYLRSAVERSLKRMGIQRIDVYLLHSPSVDCLVAGEVWETLRELVREGKIGHFGVSTSELEVMHAALDKDVEVLSVPYNLFQSVDLHRIAGEIMVTGAGILAHSTLSYGLLADGWTKDRVFEDTDHRLLRWQPHELERRIGQLDAMRFLVNGDVRTLRAAATRFALSNHLVSSAILGPRSVDQLVELVRETGGGPVYIPDKDLAALPRALSKVGIMM